MSTILNASSFALSLIGACAWGDMTIADENSDYVVTDFTSYAGHYGVTNGISDRDFSGIMVNLSNGVGNGLHVEAAWQWREEDSGLVSVGYSWELVEDLRAKISVGSSSQNDGIFPEVLARVGLTYDSGPDVGLVSSIGLTASSYRNGATTTMLQGGIVKYFSANEFGSYVVGQVDGNVTWAQPGSNLGWEVSGGLTLVNPSGLNFGLQAALGLTAYDTIAVSNVQNRFRSVRPSVSYRLNDKTEIFARGEFMDSELYDLSGIFVGLKLQH